MSDHQTELVPERDLRDLFARHRPDPDRFLAGVRRKTRERRRAEEGRLRTQAHWQRVAASLVPGLPVSTSKTGGILWILSLPVLLLAGSFVAFSAGVHAVSRGEDPAGRPRAALGGFLVGVVQLGPLLLVAAATLLGSGATIDVLMVLLSVAMIGFVLLVRRAAASDRFLPADVAGVGAGLLVAVFTGCFLWTFAWPLAIDSDLGVGASASVVLGGIAVLAVLRCWCTGGSSRYVELLPVGACLGFVLLLNPTGCTFATPEQLTRDVEAFAANTASLRGWRETAAGVETIRSIGAPAPDLAKIDAAVAGAIRDGDGKTHPVIWTAAARMGVVADEEWRELAARRMEAHVLDRLLSGTGRLHWSDHHEYRLWMLLGARELTPEQRQHLAARIEASWPRADESRALDRAALCVRLADALGRPDLVEARRAAIHATLRRHWVGSSRSLFAPVGGFTSDPEELAWSLRESTWEGVALMARVGVPEGIDLPKLRAHLRHESRESFLFPGGDLGQLERAALVRVEREIGLPERTLLEVLIGERLLIATSLVVLLCLLAVAISTQPGSGGTS